MSRPPVPPAPPVRRVHVVVPAHDEEELVTGCLEALVVAMDAVGTAGPDLRCTLVLDDDYSSSRHARIFPQGDQWYVEDLGSTNGTFIGDQQVTSPIHLAPGVGVQIGRSVVELQG